MPPQPPDLSDVVSRFQAPTDETFSLRRAVLTCLHTRHLDQAYSRAEAALRHGVIHSDRHLQAFACALLAAVHAAQNQFDEAVHRAEDGYRLFNQAGDQIHNAMIARMLLAVIYRMHLDAISHALIDTLQDGLTHSKALSARALSQGKTALAEEYEDQAFELGDWIRRARWVEAFPHLLPLVWVPVIDAVPADPDTQGAEPIGYMEPVLFVLKGRNEVQREDSDAGDDNQVTDLLYTARPLPFSGDDLESDADRPPRLKPNARYAAIKVDPNSAAVADLMPDDYLLVRSLSSAERAELLKQAGRNFAGFYFQVDANGRVEVLNAVPPRFVGEDEIRMLVAQVDAILRRVP